jgi:GTPase SAR1 family protein
MNMNLTDQEDYHYRFKIVVLGDVKSGKSTFLDSNKKFN